MTKIKQHKNNSYKTHVIVSVQTTGKYLSDSIPNPLTHVFFIYMSTQSNHLFLMHMYIYLFMCQLCLKTCIYSNFPVNSFKTPVPIPVAINSFHFLDFPSSEHCSLPLFQGFLLSVITFCCCPTVVIKVVIIMYMRISA